MLHSIHACAFNTVSYYNMYFIHYTFYNVYRKLVAYSDKPINNDHQNLQFYSALWSNFASFCSVLLFSSASFPSLALAAEHRGGGGEQKETTWPEKLLQMNANVAQYLLDVGNILVTRSPFNLICQ